MSLNPNSDIKRDRAPLVSAADYARRLLHSYPNSQALLLLRSMYWNLHWMLRAPSLCMDTNYELFQKPISDADENKVPGDICEIGAFNGMGSAMLARMCRRNNRKIVVIEPFGAGNDTSINQVSSECVNDDYRRLLSFWNQRLLFTLNTFRYRSRIRLIAQDSAKVQFPCEQKFAFSFIDGNHTPEYVRSDFQKVFLHTSVNGYIALHDYGSPHLPMMTTVIDEIKNEYAGRIDLHKLYRDYLTILFRKTAN